jgi:ubiquitin-conjugating enzyme E2 W
MRPQISNSLPPGIELVSADNLEEWLLDIKVLDTNPLYQNETYRLKFRFSSTYPIGMFFLPCPMRSTRPST